MKLLLPLLLACLALGHSAASDFIYQAAPGYYERHGQDLVIGFNVRKAGEQHTVARFLFSGSSKWLPFFTALIKSDDLQQTYFEITTAQELQPRTTWMTPGLGVVTRDTLRDLRDPWSRDIEKTRRPLPEAQILSMKTISQNQYLQITPRIIKVPAGAQ